ncbi:MAG: helix-turn-helix domain-containing protein [Oscillochloridaceae bacterium umkhey_bin13]
MDLVARGKSDRRIALILNLAPQTVTHYVQRATQKLGARNRTAAAVRYAAHAWPPTAAAPLADPLSAQEGRVLALVAAGLTDQQIALHLQLGPSTVKQHLLSARRKLGVPNRTAATPPFALQPAAPRPSAGLVLGRRVLLRFRLRCNRSHHRQA